KVMKVTEPEILRLTAFSNEEILKLMESCYNITNPLYTDRIMAIAQGNARLAMLAGKLIVNSGCLDTIQDASDLYRNYYKEQLDAGKSGMPAMYGAKVRRAFHRPAIARERGTP